MPLCKSRGMFLLPSKIKKIVFIAIGLVYFGFFVLISQIPDNKFHIYFLDIGQGDSVLIKTPQNHQMLIDGGPNSSVIERLSGIMPFFDNSIDFIILTHPHADHVNGLIEVLKKYSVNAILMTGVSSKSPIYEEFLRTVYNKKIPVFIAESKTDFKFGNVFFDVIYPFNQISGEYFENPNNSSVAVKVSYKDELSRVSEKILLTGDLQDIIESKLVDAGIDLKANILKAGHHGSKNASSLKFLNKVKPDFAVIQSGKDNRFGHPHKQTLDNLKKAGVKKIYRNDMDGTVEFVF
ncbi:MBL fold metallo-hydrolase [Candidatus Peregrinibacteria bacterium]|nr:MBL fold metallo-hydrolase [Candidatus Peregrinibacteria bacterium]